MEKRACVMQARLVENPHQVLVNSKQTQRPDRQLKPAVPLVNLGNLIQEDETASWFQYTLDNFISHEHIKSVSKLSQKNFTSRLHKSAFYPDVENVSISFPIYF